MKFYKSCESFSFFMSTYVVFFIQILYIYKINDDFSVENNEKNKALIICKEIFCVLFTLTFCSHFASSFSNPGIIQKQNSKEILEFYNTTYKEILKTKAKYERVNVIEKEKEIYSDEEDEYSEGDNDIDISREYLDNSNLQIINTPKLNNNQKKKKIVSKKYDFELTKCKTCLVLRPKSSHHCSDCHICVLDRNNHCPWMNNCIGLFNRKFFILFCLYSVITVAYSFSIYFYYVVFKNFKTFRRSFARSMSGIFFMFFSFIYGGFCYTMLKDERKDIIKEFRSYGNEKKKLMKLKMKIIFGGNFSLKWFFPCFKGGKNNFNSFLGKKTKETNNKAKKKFNRKGLLFKSD